jgi:hypothetical protein
MEDIGIASLFARQAATAIRVAARAREIRIVLADVLASDEETPDDAAVRELVSAATRRHAGDDRFWAFVDAIAGMRHASPADRELAIELLRVIGRHGASTSRETTGRRLRQRR